MADENALRASWKTGSPCQIYSNSKKKWFMGEVAQIFTDEEGEWLEVRYDKSMSKQVQRYSSDIRPHPDDLKKKKPKKTESSPFPDQEMKVRQSWDKGDEVEIFSNTHQEWYLGEIVDIIKDEEGEWLNCVWARSNGEAMSKQVQRFSTDVRPVQDDTSEGSTSDDAVPSSNNQSKKPLSAKEETQAEAAKIQQRKTNFRRRAPPFSRTLRASTFTYPATSSARRSRKLLDLEETNERNQHVVDEMPGLKDDKSSQKLKKDIAKMKPAEVREFIRSLGSAYERYAIKFKVRGSQLIMFNEAQLERFVATKLHRHRILMEIARHSPNRADSYVFNHDIEALGWDSSRVRQWCNENKFMKLYADKFWNHGIDGMLLFELDAKDLSTVGVKKMHQTRVLEIIAKFASEVFPADNDDAKEEEPGKLGLNGSVEGAKGHKRRGSVAHDNSLMNGGLNGTASMNQNNDAIIFTMGQLLLELGQMFKVGKVQDLTTILKQQLDELQQNSNHPQMSARGSMVNLNLTPTMDDDDDDSELNEESPNGNNLPDAARMRIMGDRVDTSPAGVDAAWMATQKGVKGHRRRGSLPFINANQLEDDDDGDLSPMSD